MSARFLRVRSRAKGAGAGAGDGSGANGARRNRERGRGEACIKSPAVAIVLLASRTGDWRALKMARDANQLAGPAPTGDPFVWPALKINKALETTQLEWRAPAASRPGRLTGPLGGHAKRIMSPSGPTGRPAGQRHETQMELNWRGPHFATAFYPKLAGRPSRIAIWVSLVALRRTQARAWRPRKRRLPRPG